jgi:hypothetical protein
MATHLLQLRRYSETGVLIGTIDLVGATTTATYTVRLRKRIPSFGKYKDQWQNSPTLDGRKLVDFRLDVSTETIVVDITATSTKNLQLGIAHFQGYMRGVREGQKAKNQGKPYISTQLWANPLQNMTTSSHSEIISMEIDGMEDYYGSDIISSHAENITLTLTLSPYWTASVLDLVTDAAVSNGAANYIQVTGDTTAYTVTNAALTGNVATLTIGEHLLTVGDWFTASNVTADASLNGLYKISAIAATASISYALTHADIASATSTGDVVGQYTLGTRSAATRHKVVGGTSATSKLQIGVKKQGNVANFTTHHLWAKDATLHVSTVAATSTNFDGNGTGSGTTTTATGTSETRTHFFVVTSNVPDQYGIFRVFLRARQSTASRYSARLRVGIADGTNTIYGGYSIATPVTIGTDSGNALAWVDLGTIDVPAKASRGATIHGLVYELYLTCSNVTGSPTASVDGLWLFPTGEGDDETGMVIATYDLGTAASGVGSAFISALPDEPTAYLSSTADVITFPTLNIEDGTGIMVEPERALRVYYALVDETTSAGNPRHDHTTALTVSMDYEVRYGAEGRTEN